MLLLVGGAYGLYWAIMGLFKDSILCGCDETEPKTVKAEKAEHEAPSVDTGALAA